MAIPMPSLWELHQFFRYEPYTGHLINKALKRRVGWKKRCERPARRVWFGNEQYAEHRLIWFMQTGVDPQRGTIMHLNGNRTDNRWDNLKFVPHPKDDYSQQTCSPPLIEHPCATTCETNKVYSFGTLEVTRTPSGTLTFTKRTLGLIQRDVRQRQKLSA